MFNVLTEAERVLQHVAAIGVPWTGTRFERYVEAVRTHAKPSREFIRQYRESEEVQRHTFEAGSQLIQLIVAESAWKEVDRARLRAALTTVMAGPDVSEDPDDQPRNTLLELIATAELADRGFKVDLTKNKEDVALECPGVGSGAAECKRPLRPENILSNLQRIGEQLRRREKAGSKFGIAVIGADRLAGTPCTASTAEAWPRAAR